MSNGVSQREACQDWGMQFRTDSYQKLSLILIQSFTKGSKEAAMLMEAEEREAFYKRIDRAKKEGEEASTRLLFPMILLLCQVMLLVMYGTDSLSGILILEDVIRACLKIQFL